MTLTLPLPKRLGGWDREGAGQWHNGTARMVYVLFLCWLSVITGPRSYCLLPLASSPRLAGLE